jgi:predicted N-formylglutamate amidohydrolase
VKDFIPGLRGAEMLLIADHASNHVPDDIGLGIAPHLLGLHIALDIGVAPLARALNRKIGCACILGGVSRLVLDLNREEDAANIIPLQSDGHAIPGNQLTPEQHRARIDRFWGPYHQFIADQITETQPKLLISLHSFTPSLKTRPEEDRPWEIGVLYNEDDRAARIAIPALAAQGVIVGDQEPYSGKLLNATMNMHGEANGIPYLGLEVRQDLIGDPAGVEIWANRLAPVIEDCLSAIDTP